MDQIYLVALRCKLASCFVRMGEYDQSFFNTHGARSGFDLLADPEHPDTYQQWSVYSNSPRMFKMNDTAGHIALRIIKAHPLEYLRRVFREYKYMYEPLEICPDPEDRFEGEPAIAYRAVEEKCAYPDFRLFPGRGRPNPALSNRSVVNAIYAWTEIPIFQRLLNWYYASELILSHLLFIAVVTCCVLTQPSRAKWQIPVDLHRISIAVILLFATSATNYLVVALANVARRRYEVPWELELHLMLLISIFTVIRIFLAYRPQLIASVSALIRVPGVMSHD